jgi:hypothetical protein
MASEGQFVFGMLRCVGHDTELEHDNRYRADLEGPGDE